LRIDVLMLKTAAELGQHGGRGDLVCDSCSPGLGFLPMTTLGLLQCDGCGQPASPEHFTKRLQRLEWMTQYRPVHVGTVILGAISPRLDRDFLYSDAGEFAGEAKRVLVAAGVSSVVTSKDATLSEFQRGGFLLGYVLECPLNDGSGDPAAVQALLKSRLALLLARIRRSYRPKRIAPISTLLSPLLGSLTEKDLGCAVVLEGDKPFALDGDASDEAATRLGQVLASIGAAAH
jgi:hypothetical protein